MAKQRIVGGLLGGATKEVSHVIDLIVQRRAVWGGEYQALSFISPFAAEANASSIKGSIWLATAFTTGTTTLFPN